MRYKNKEIDMKVITAEMALSHPAVKELLSTMTATTQRIAKEREALAKDAARYRWIRDFNTDAMIFMPNIEPDFGNDVAGVALDTEIDAEIEAAQADQDCP